MIQQVSSKLHMPKWLGLLAAGGLIAPFIALIRLLAGAGPFGDRVDLDTAASVAAVGAYLLPALLMGLSSILILGRSRYGRPVHLLGWLTTIVGAYAGAQWTHASPPMLMEGLAFLLVLACATAIYLYVAREVGEYFGQ